MGTPGTGPFEGPAAADWVWRLESEGLTALEDALGPASTASPAELEDAEVLAACAVVAAMTSGSDRPLPAGVEAFLAARAGPPPPALQQLARSAVVRLLHEDATLLRDREQAGHADDYRALVADVQDRLG